MIQIWKHTTYPLKTAVLVIRYYLNTVCNGFKLLPALTNCSKVSRLPNADDNSSYMSTMPVQTYIELLTRGGFLGGGGSDHTMYNLEFGFSYPSFQQVQSIIFNILSLIVIPSLCKWYCGRFLESTPEVFSSKTE